MFCKQCGNQIKDGERFCTICGWQVTQEEQQGAASMSADSSTNTNVSGGTANNMMPGSNVVAEFNKSVHYISSSGADGFVDSDEVPLYSLSNGTLGHLVTGRGWAKDDAILTNKRLYYSYNTGILNQYSTEEIVNLNDITGSKINNYNPLIPLILSIITFVVSLILLRESSEMAFIGFGIAVFCLIFYLVRRTSVLSIEYAGGYIEFSVKNYGLKKIQAFQKCIYVAKAIADTASKSTTPDETKL